MAELGTLVGTGKLCQQSSVAEAHSTPAVWDVGCPLRLWASPPPTRILRQDSVPELLNLGMPSENLQSESTVHSPGSITQPSETESDAQAQSRPYALTT